MVTLTRGLLLGGSILSLAMFAPTQAATHAKKPIVKKAAAKPSAGTMGHEQMKGGDGIFGETYTLQGGPNFTVVGAEYSVERFNATQTSAIVPKVDEKLLVLHLKAKNPRKDDLYLSGSSVEFSTVAQDGQTRDSIHDMRLLSQKDSLSNTLKPGQPFPEELVTACVIPANGPVPKLILNTGREGTSEQVTRYMLGQGKNLVKPLPAPYADPKDPTGATALAEIPAQIGTTYVAGMFDMSLVSVAYAPGPFGDTTDGDGKQFLVVTVSATNKTWDHVYFKDTIVATLYTDDDEKTTSYTALKSKRDEAFEGRQVDPDETISLRLLFEVPKDAKGKTLKIAESVNNTGDVSRSFVYDLSKIAP